MEIIQTNSSVSLIINLNIEDMLNGKNSRVHGAPLVRQGNYNVLTGEYMG